MFEVPSVSENTKMENKMKNFAKLFLVLALFTSAAIADDGHTGSGNRDGCTVNCPPPCTENCPAGNAITTGAETVTLEDGASTEGEESLVEYYFQSVWEMFNNGL